MGESISSSGEATRERKNVGSLALSVSRSAFGAGAGADGMRGDAAEGAGAAGGERRGGGLAGAADRTSGSVGESSIRGVAGGVGCGVGFTTTTWGKRASARSELAPDGGSTFVGVLAVSSLRRGSDVVRLALAWRMLSGMMSQMIFPTEEAEGERRGSGRCVVLQELRLDDSREAASWSM